MGSLSATLLFVDDEADVRELLERTFAKRYRVLTAASGAEALEVFAREQVDVLVTDQRMPEMTGTELVAELRTRGHDVTALLLTGYTHPEDIIAAINQGQVWRYVTKPWDVRELMLTVQGAVERAHLVRDRERLHRQVEQRAAALQVLYEVGRQSAAGPLSYEAVVDRVLAAVERVLPYDCGAALVAHGDGRHGALRVRCRTRISDAALLRVPESVLGSFRSTSGVPLAEDGLLVHVTDAAGGAPGAAPPGEGVPAFASALHVPLVWQGRNHGTLSLFSAATEAFTPDDGALLDVLANQTTETIVALRTAEEQARRRIERMVEAMTDGVLLTDEKNEIVVINPAARRLLRLGDDPAHATTRHLQEQLGFYPFELVRGWEYGGAQPLREELRLFDRTVQSTVTPVNDAGGTLRGVCVVLRDVTEQKDLEARKEEFISIVSHELRTPLTSISGALDLVLNFLAGELNDKQQRYLGMAKDSTDKLNAIVDDLLDLSKFSRGRMRMNFEVSYLDEVVRRALEKYGPAFLDKHLRVESALPQHSLRVIADPNRLNQVLNNLLTNAAKFSAEGGTVRVELRASSDLPGWVVLGVSNEGDPIAEADLERIFEKFEQARTQKNRTVRGTGLGLAISRSIVEAHGGRIWAEPSTQGAHFVVALPVEPPAELQGADAPEARTPERRGTLLLVEEAPELGLALKAVLSARGWAVARARGAEEGIQLARRLQPAAALLDVRAAGAEGLRLAEALRHDPETRDVPLLVASSWDVRAQAFRAGADAFLLKPLAADQVVATLESLVRGRAGRARGRVLVVDDDPKIAAICREVLENLGLEVDTAGRLSEARGRLRERRPDVLLLDVELPDGDGFSFLEELKAERASSHLSVIFVSARTETSAKVRALKLGGDDYLTKPFDALELGARVESVLRRREQELNASPTTLLPGSGAIEREVQRRLALREPFAFCYLDLDNLKAYNDSYGFAKADGVVRQTGDLLREAVAQEGGGGDFLGHVAGDDFVFITTHARADALCRRVIDAFDRVIPLYYERQDRERGYIEAEDRFGERRRFPVMSVSVVAVITDGTQEHAELARQAAELKKRAKSIPGSVYLRSDRPDPRATGTG